MIKVLYSTLEGRDRKIFIDIDKMEMELNIGKTPKDFNDKNIKELIKMLIDKSKIEYRLDPFIKHLEETGIHKDLEEEDDGK